MARLVAVMAALFLTLPITASAAERLCDPAFEDCRKPLLALINNETKGIDVAFWFMTDTKYSNAIIARWNAGVPVRVLMDTEANAAHADNAAILSQLKAAGIPMRQKTTGGILHWKTMLFVGQNTVEFSGANYSTVAFGFGTPYEDYEDEIIFFSDTPSIVNSFKTSYDDKWVTTSGYANYANIAGTPVRTYPVYTKDPELNFPPGENYRTRAVNAYKAETVGIDVSMFRITDRAHSDAMIAAVKRGVPVRLITEQDEYRNPDRLWDSYNVDMMYAAGVQVKFRGHNGITHEKLVLLTGQDMAIFGSSNWTSPSAASQAEHNLFTTDATRVAWLRDHWNRKWFNTGPSPETMAFTPLPPSTPTLHSPAEGATGVATSTTLKWYAGKWAHKYDVYIGTSTSSMARVLTNTELGPSETSTDYKSFAVSGLKAGTKYYWKVVSRTMANLTATSATGSFTTTSSTTTSGPLPSGWSSRDVGSVGATGSASYSSGVFTVKGAGADVWNGADEFQFVYHSLSGDGSIVARVSSVQNVASWTKAGVMMRESLSAGAKNAFMLVSAAKGLAFQRRTSTSGSTTSTIVSGAAPYWVKVTRSGSTFSAYVSADGSAWKLVGSQSITMTATISVGLAVGSHVDGTVATAKFDHVSIESGATTTTASLPTGWSTRDVGAVAASGGADYASGTYTVKGSGDDIWGTADAFRFAYHKLTGDGSIVARVASLQAVEAWTKAGVMMRETLDAGSKHVSMIVSSAKGLAYQRRLHTNGESVSASAGAGTAPFWVKVQRIGNTFSGFISSNGSTWKQIGSDSILMTSTIYVGLAVTSHHDGSLATARFDGVN